MLDGTARSIIAAWTRNLRECDFLGLGPLLNDQNEYRLESLCLFARLFDSDFAADAWAANALEEVGRLLDKRCQVVFVSEGQLREALEEVFWLMLHLQIEDSPQLSTASSLLHQGLLVALTAG